jgi:hypothetical protein
MMTEATIVERRPGAEAHAAVLPSGAPGASDYRVRRSFAIISHPDAGKTTLTEKLLLKGGAIRMAGAVRARGEQRRTRSDWMQIERERGISVSSTVMRFERDGLVFNLLDTPGHEDFSEDTYRTLTAVDSAIMVIDAAKASRRRPESSSKSAGCATPPHHHFRQQGRSRGPPPLRASGRDRGEPGRSTPLR